MFRKGFFSRVSRSASQAFGHPLAFGIAVLCVIVWALLGPAFRFGDTWQLTINTGTTIVTFLMVFLIQNSQNRHSDAIQLKLDELIRAIAGAHNYLMDLEEATDEEVAELKSRYRRLHALAAAGRKPRG
jgi:low affinity Fe/Cu permease